MTSVRSPSASRRGSNGSSSGNGTARPRSGTGSTSGAASRPFSSTNLSATVASSRFKTFAVQYEILCKNTILCELAKEVPWKNLLDLFTLKFYAVGDVLWRHGDHPSELAFVLCGGFLIRHMKQDQPNQQLSSSSHSSFQYGDKPAVERTETIVAEKLLKPGASIAVYAVDQNVPMRYNVVTAKFKSISIALPLGKFKSVLRQLTPATKTTLQQLILENETKLCGSIRLPPPQCTFQQRATRASRATTAPTVLSSSSATSHSRQSHHSPLKKVVSTPVIAPNVTVSWDSLQVAQPVEYEVNSSLLILHDSALKTKHHIPTSTATSSSSTKLLRSVSSSALVRTVAKKHTTRRLQSIKLPATIDAFPPQPHADKYRNIEAEALAASAAAALHSIDVVPKIRIGRLLAPIDKPAVVENTEQDVEIARPRRASHTTTTSSYQSLAGRHILLADRGKKYREEF